MSNESLPPLFFEIFNHHLDRQGPGDDESTRQAFVLATAHGLSAGSYRILDLGCGTGSQSLALAALAPKASILAIDTHAPFIDQLNRLARERGLSNRLQARVGDMGKLDLPPGCADIIWSEGALYQIGIGEGLRALRPLLAPNGRIAFTELCWLTETRPEECAEFWAREYPAMQTIREVVSVIHEAGFGVVGHFVLPNASWWEHYYDQLQDNVTRQRELRRDDPEAMKLIEWVQAEIDQRRQFPEYYGYVFFVLQPEEPNAQ